ncbi:chemotaxis protein CheW [Microbulbifer thermotolerans]|uniref:Chemotaxis protein CheW n=1 Tax=Microbulbifer thermotolerans TaxID=252514 RepID=A0A143HN81_MICTH|nr:chemotaxis protein CheW [Microbulbifer thermotolerans]AMX03205.1 chemotaxis protein CheW [Microbulbifer thermotolerans]MCX2783507.1 chemotaxis protein CheW [Microbulbifer thermotolerans]MCX2795901.1 chemotaxis protein CheW [Microbulbifer thermotolerans]MCX2835559.1 chemotaxis protein CheW [Microbulbifer thermotolerans]WKT59771.1 chemotaxis protein CheW [Microbulbifer thermotolerans]
MTNTSAQEIAAAESGNREFLVFSLGDEEYAIDILKVQEIRGYDNVTRIANAPDFIKGVANLRGVIVPIVDLRIKFRLSSAEYDAQTVVIVVNIAERVVGMVVDRVSDVMTLSGEQIKAAPEFGVGLPLAYIEGLGNLGERMLVLVDIEKLLTSEEMALVDKAEENQQ